MVMMSNGDADGHEVEADADTGNECTERLQLSHADVAVLETSSARSPSVDLTASCSTASPPAMRLKVLTLRGLLWVMNFQIVK